ncbi:Golgi apparatus membrane protein TVP23 [Fasciola hepatica]|uniref:Golgi apparatus membrane protein TVP23 homolog n=1 Tax=Fasciola hepatica TaxID=6192 RepID=A0A2H1CTV4_FASHE|nr:Golgi apparatus membrane protein TVP23 [Fasciola hepatica]
MDSRDEVVLALTDDIDADEQGASGGGGAGSFGASSRRFALLGHFGFRVAAIVVYLFCSWFTYSFVLPFVLVLISLALDFWFVKNISGRILVGLRWSSYTDENGQPRWRFDARPPVPEPAQGVQLTRRELAARAAQANAARLFWIGLVATPFVWGLFLLVAVFSLRLRWALVSAMAMGMSAVNLFAYIRCRVSNTFGDGVSPSSLLTGFQAKVARQMFSDWISSMTKGGSSRSAASNLPTGSATMEA